MNKIPFINTLIALIALAYTAGFLKPLDPKPEPTPAPYVLCVSQPPATTCLLRV
ncbi:hypothetical protein [Pseudomonas sp.]|uniref:hypothetical protein n=1 Tax=Pseudomonas sp. TaxID=306 RepID=UPI003D112B63